MSQLPLPIQANNVLYYYHDLAAATHFYQEVLGFDLVEDYGVAKLFQVASTSFMMLIDAGIGRHSAVEPKTVTTALITDELEGWWDYLQSQGANISHPLNYKPGQPHDGFVVVDPDGYYLEFERFNPHPENDRLLPLLTLLPGHYPKPGPATTCPAHLGVKGTITWLYYRDLAAAQCFFAEVMGWPSLLEQNIASVHPTSRSGFIGPVRAGAGLHSYTEQKGVTVSLFTEQIDAWFAYLQTQPAFRLEDKEIKLEMESVRDFLGFDPEGYFIEFDAFLDHPKNAAILARLSKTNP